MQIVLFILNGGWTLVFLFCFFRKDNQLSSIVGGAICGPQVFMSMFMLVVVKM